MYPVLISLGPISIYTLHIFALLAWGVFSFLFWKELRAQGVLEERIFDLTFYATLFGGIAARLGFVILFPNLFVGSILLIGAFWVQPGLWLYSGLIGVLATFYLLSRRYNLRFSILFDAFSMAFPWTMIPLALGTFFAGHEVGKVTNFLLSVVYPGVEGRRYPVQLYEIIVYVIIGLIAIPVHKKIIQSKLPSGLLGSLVFTLLAPALFALEFLKDSSLYLYNINVNQWILILLFAESFGSLIIKLKRMGILFPKKGEKKHEPDTSESK